MEMYELIKCDDDGNEEVLDTITFEFDATNYTDACQQAEDYLIPYDLLDAYYNNSARDEEGLYFTDGVYDYWVREA